MARKRYVLGNTAFALIVVQCASVFWGLMVSSLRFRGESQTRKSEYEDVRPLAKWLKVENGNNTSSNFKI